jgi:threonyl-tRNA synthetase
VIGAQEAEDKTVAVACRDEGDLGVMSIDAFIAKLLPEIASKL